MKRKIKDTLIVVISAVVIAFIINKFILINVVVPTRSMEPFIAADDRLFAFRLAYVFDEPKRGDVVVFTSDYEDKLLLKRIIGLPGDSVRIADGLIYINGEAIEDYTKVSTKFDYQPDWDVIPEDQYFMLGDNRNNSKDSPEWEMEFGDPFIDKDDIVGRIFFKYYPRRKFF